MKKSYIIAIAMTVAIVAWMASGLLRDSPTEQTSTAADKQDEQRLLVQTEIQTAQPVQLTLKVVSHVEPNRKVTIRSDIAGRIDEVLAKEGTWVASGDVLVRLAVEDRRIKLDKERALLLSKQKAYKRIKALTQDSYQSKSALEEAYASLKAAEANVAQMEFELEKLDIKAPFSGLLDARMVEQGGYVSANSEIARFVDNSPLIVVAPVSQQDIQQLSVGLQAEVAFATGAARQGKVIYISPLANESTRTFRVEIAVNNDDRSIPAGISAEVRIPTEKVTGHFISPAILSLDSTGQIGVKTVDEKGAVTFNPVSIIQAAEDGVWVTGLPQKAQIITVGQGFVEEGVYVDVHSAEKTSTPSFRDNTTLENQSNKVSL
ncbi:efflux RND transporter periplasmic adaptor subunit [Alteromonas genovensis]|uniref:efflux RND transporter periplasmic adaptor subunit n=1 Tax=Alteromonas genovensis TaxID=471225 RepID=UPI002FE2399F